MKFLRSKRGVALMAALLLALFLFRPAIHQLRDRIANSIGAALGRRVDIDDVHFRVLPRPGFDLEGIVIYDEPSFGTEPMMRSQDVFAAIRLRSLFRGRLEIARLSATEPSINVVRNSQGQWNLARLIERNAQIPAAPTLKASSERRPGFPYLEATGARINFKIGPEKKSYALIDADVALWQDSENSWGARMKAQPMRTDFNLTDTGRMLIDANWQRSRNLRLTPVRVAIAWENGQLGQITQLLSGRDRGFRGAVELTANLSGTPQDLKIDSRAVVNGFRRYDIVDNRILNLATGCTGRYSVGTGSFSDLSCDSLIDGGLLRLTGRIGLTSSVPRTKAGARAPDDRHDDDWAYDLTLTAKKVPLSSGMALLHQAKQQLPADLTASGEIESVIRAAREGAETEFTGSGTATDVRFIFNAGRDVLALGNVPLSLIGGPGTAGAKKIMRAKVREPEGAGSDQGPTEPHLRVGPASLQINTAPPVGVGGWVSASGYRFFLRGDLALKNLFRVETALGLPSVRPAAEGDVKLDVAVSGNWRGLAQPNALGTAQLRNVRAETHGLNTPIEISSAAVVLTPDAFSMNKVQAQTGDTHWTGSVSAPRHCAPACVFQFDLTADRISAGVLGRWFTLQPAKRPWYRLLNSADAPGRSPLLALRAHGNLRVGRLELKKVIATGVATQLKVDQGKVEMTRLTAAVLQGTHQGDWTVDTSTSPPQYRGSGTLSNISLSQVAALMNDSWIAGSADGSLEFETSGENFAELNANANGKLRFTMRDGTLTHIQFPDARGPFSVHRFTGTIEDRKGTWELSEGHLQSRDGLYMVSGTAEPEDALHFVLRRSDEQSWNLTGTLAKPHLIPVNQEISRKVPSDAKP